MNIPITIISLTLLAVVSLILLRGKKNNEEPDILSICACNVYWEDYQQTSLTGVKAAKFVVIFDSPSSVNLRLINSFLVDGPGGYRLDFKIQPFNFKNLNGHLKEANGYVWFQVYDPEGFLENGEYTITLKYRSGKTSSMSRVLDYTEDLLEAYQAMQPSFTPSGIIQPSDVENIELKWTVVPEIDAYYTTRMWNVSAPMLSAIKKQLFYNSIFRHTDDSDPDIGLNNNSVKIPFTLDPAEQYSWFTEILDSNHLCHINIAIFQRWQFFRFKQNSE